MEALKKLVSECHENRKCPEAVLGLPHASTDFKFPRGGLQYWQETAIQRLPKVMERLVRLQGTHAAEAAGLLTAALISPTDTETGQAALEKIYAAGISLTWLCFGLGTPSTQPGCILPWIPDNKNRVPYMAIQRAAQKQGLLPHERIWWSGMYRKGSGRMRHAILYMLYALPIQNVFPRSPEPDETFERVMQAFHNCPADSISYKDWMPDVIMKIRDSRMLLPLLFLSRQSSLSRWRRGENRANVMTRRYCLLVERIFDSYGDTLGVSILLDLLDNLARFFGLESFAHVVEQGSWRDPDDLKGKEN